MCTLFIWFPLLRRKHHLSCCPVGMYWLALRLGPLIKIISRSYGINKFTRTVLFSTTSTWRVYMICFPNCDHGFTLLCLLWPCFNSLASQWSGSNFGDIFSNSFYKFISWALPVKLVVGECLGSGKGFLSSSYKPLSEQMLAKLYVTMCHI